MLVCTNISRVLFVHLSLKLDKQKDFSLKERCTMWSFTLARRCRTRSCGTSCTFSVNHSRISFSLECRDEFLSKSDCLRRCTTRPCTQVRILPFHLPNHLESSSLKTFAFRDAESFRFWRLCSHLLNHFRRALPATLSCTFLNTYPLRSIHHNKNDRSQLKSNYLRRCTICARTFLPAPLSVATI